MFESFLATLGLVLQMSMNVPGIVGDGPQLWSLTSPVQWSCTNPSWSQGPRVSDGAFRGELETECTIAGATKQGLVSLNQKLVSSATYNVTVHAGPIDETFGGLPGVRFDVTEKMGKSDPLYVRQDIHVSTNGSTRLFYASLSKEIKASGMAEYLRRMDSNLDVSPTGEPGAYRLTFRSYIEAAKPWYAPSGIFESKVESLARQKFQEARATIMPTIANAL